MKKLKIAYFADGIWSHNAFNLILQDKRFEIKAVIPRFDSKDEVLLNLAKQHNIDYIKTDNVNSKEFIQTIQKYNCDIFVSMSFNQIFKKDIINTPPIRSSTATQENCHFIEGETF